MPRMAPYSPMVALVLCTRPSYSVISQICRGLHTVPSGVDPSGPRYCPRGVRVVRIRNNVCTRVVAYPVCVLLALPVLTKERLAEGIGVCTPCGAVLTLQKSVFTPRLLGL